MKKYLFFIIYFLSFHFVALGQINANGLPLITNYSPENYNAAGQNWAITKDNKGIMYFGNNFGLLEYNGTNWKLHNNPESTVIRSLATCSDGTVFYGSTGDFGLVAPDSIGNLSFISLSEECGIDKNSFTSVWKTHVIDKRVYFQSSERIFEYSLPYNSTEKKEKDQKIKSWKSESSFHQTFVLNNKLYIREFDKGLQVLKGDKIELVPEGDFFANLKIYVMLPYSKTKILIGTREAGFFLFDIRKTEKAITPFKLSTPQFLENTYLYGGVVLPDGQFAIGTLVNGIIIFDKAGTVTQVYNNETGFSDNSILSLYCDQNNLWVTSGEKGIFKIDVGSPFTEWNENNGLNGVISDIIRFDGILYLSTNVGVFYLEKQANGFSQFKAIENLNFETWNLLDFKIAEENKSKLLVATGDGIFEIQNFKAEKILQARNTFKLYQSKKKPEILLAGFLDGFGVLEYSEKEKKWGDLQRNDSVIYTILDIYESEKGQVFLGTEADGALVLNDFFDEKYKLIAKEEGLPVENETSISEINGEIVFSCFGGLYNYNENEQKVYPYQKLGKQFSESDIGAYFITKDQENFWLSAYSNESDKVWKGVIQIQLTDSGYLSNEKLTKRIPQKLANAIFSEKNNVWIANDKGLYQFNKKNKFKNKVSFHTFITRVSTVDDSLLFGGFNYDLEKNILVLENITKQKTALKYATNTIVFEYSSAFFDLEEKTEYSYRLLGRSEKWSRWTSETKFPFTNLWEGDYNFEVKSRNIYGIESEIANYEFTIKPPWFRTVWAYILFALTGGFLVWGIVKLNTKRLIIDKQRLEELVDQRTKEVRDKNVILSNQKKEIEIKNNKITSSISYARKIQEAVLPPKALLSEFLPDHFIYFKPRDIVSGDFYWMKQIGKYTLYAAADCTGHGVPGAFMSMLGIAFLNEIVTHENLETPDLILNNLRDKVKHSLRQTKKNREGTKDGMDIALCVINQETLELEYAGAYNPLYIIRDGELHEIKANKNPIGIYLKEKPFTLNKYQLKKKDLVYTFSDGFIDQFGGENDDKYKAKNFKKFLIRISEQSMFEQKISLDNEFNNWRGETQQLDDVIIIGLKI